MYICKDCGYVFEEPVVEYDDPSPAGVSLASGAYEYESCPHCGSDDIDGAEVCACCGEWYDGTKNSKIVCGDCYEDIEQELEAIRKGHNLSKDDFEEVITEIFGW